MNLRVTPSKNDVLYAFQDPTVPLPDQTPEAAQEPPPSTEQQTPDESDEHNGHVEEFEDERPVNLEEVFAQLPQAIRQLKERRVLLLKELELTDARLRMFGVEVPEDPNKPQKPQKPRATRAKRAVRATRFNAKERAAEILEPLSPTPEDVPLMKADGSKLRGAERIAFIYRYMTKKPERQYALGNRLRISTKDINNAMRSLIKNGKVGRTLVQENGETHSAYFKI